MIEGEDAVNVIRQKTAVRPVVEVRDRNDLPVPGALVTFSIPGGQAATFGGASTVTVATNAAGQAAVTSLTPSAAGAFQIQVSAAFQGQVATATIAQTNVMTAAQAAAASAASGSTGSASSGGAAGGAAGGGGGLSATTIGIVGAAVAGGAVAATQLTDQEASDQVFTGSFSGTLTSTIVNAVSTCVITRNLSANIRITLQSTNPIGGRSKIEGTDTVVSGTCPSSQTAPFQNEAELGGSAAAFGFQQTLNSSSPDPLDGGIITATTTILFEASLANDVITGTLKYNQTSTKSGPQSNTQSATGTFPMTLRKTP